MDSADRRLVAPARPGGDHWGVNGIPDAHLPQWALPLLTVFVVGMGLHTTSLFRHEGRSSAEVFAIVGLLGGLGSVLMIRVVYLNWDAPRWEEQIPSAGFTCLLR